MTDSILPNRSVLANLAMHQLADQLAPPQEAAVAVTRRWGTVQAVHTNTVDVEIGAVTITGLAYLSWYSPTVGDTVAVDVVGADLAVVGTTAPGNPNLTVAGTLSLTNPGTQTTAPAAGAASALPATPAGYVAVTIAGTVRHIPYY